MDLANIIMPIVSIVQTAKKKGKLHQTRSKLRGKV